MSHHVHISHHHNHLVTKNVIKPWKGPARLDSGCSNNIFHPHSHSHLPTNSTFPNNSPIIKAINHVNNSNCTTNTWSVGAGQTYYSSSTTICK